jgi:hypothetical protein
MVTAHTSSRTCSHTLASNRQLCKRVCAHRVAVGLVGVPRQQQATKLGNPVQVGLCQHTLLDLQYPSVSIASYNPLGGSQRVQPSDPNADICMHTYIRIYTMCVIVYTCIVASRQCGYVKQKVAHLVRVLIIGQAGVTLRLLHILRRAAEQLQKDHSLQE